MLNFFSTLTTMALIRGRFLKIFGIGFLAFLLLPSLADLIPHELTAKIIKISLRSLIFIWLVYLVVQVVQSVSALKKEQPNQERFFAIPYSERFLFIGFFVAAISGGIFLGVISYFLESKEDIKKLASFKPAIPTTLYDVKGRKISELFLHQREMVKLEDVPKPVISAFLAVEDTNFYNHFGIDFIGILRAMWANLKAFSVVQGGSTLTQQLVKGLYTESEKTIWRKLYEAILALQVEKEFSKEEILEMYFNQIFFGHGCYGISSAAQFYFDKPVQKLNIIEGAILAAMPKAPHSYSPIRSPHVALKKNKIILNRLVDLGYLSNAEAESSYQEFWNRYWPKLMQTASSATIFGAKTNQAPYFTESVRQELVGLFGEEVVYSKGLKVYTTLDLDQQMVAEEEMQATLKKLDPVARTYNASRSFGVDYEALSALNILRNIIPLPFEKKVESFRSDFRVAIKDNVSDALELISMITPVYEVNEASREFLAATREFKTELFPQGALLAMEPKTGRMTAMIGGREFKASDQYNRALQARRQPGSAFKPFVYAAALEDRAVHSAMGFLDSPLLNLEQDGSMWAPSNYEGTYRGYVTLDMALAMSLNIVSVQVYEKVGADKVIDFTSRVTKAPARRFRPDHSLALGSSEITPKEMLQGYAIFANEGQDVIPHMIVYVTDRDGNVIYNQEKLIFEALNYKKRSGKLQIIEKSVAFIIRSMMEGVANFGTAAGSIRGDGGYRGPAAGKTGTTSSWNDAWFGGFSTDLAAVVWFGMDNGSMTLGPGVAGGSFSAPTWGRFMRRTYEKRGSLPQPFPREIPPGVSGGGVCADSGLWPNSECEKPCPMRGTLIPDPIKIGNVTKRVGGEKWDCSVTETKNFFELMQEQNQITDEELGKQKKFNQKFDSP